MKIDAIDKQILDCLELDGRLPYSAIAKEVGLTSTAIGQRVQKMIEEEVIEGFSVRLNQQKLEISIQAIVTLKLSFASIDAFNKILGSFEEVQSCYRVTGEDCLIMKVHLKDNNHLLDFLNRVTAYGSTKTNIILEELV